MGATYPVNTSTSSSSKNVSQQVESCPSLSVWWDEPEDQDPENPMNWPATKKWANFLTISVMSFLVPLVSSVVAPAVELILVDFHSSSTTFPTFVLSIFVLGFAVGPLLLPPLSELYGRVIIYNVTNVLFVVFTIMCAVSHNEAMLLGFRFLSGFAGVATISIGPASIADIMPREKRGKAVSLWAVGTVIGPMVGPIIGGYVAEVLGWRWIFWIISIIAGLVTVVALAILRETYPPVLLERKASRLRKETGNTNYRSRLASDLGLQELVLRSIMRPSKMLLLCPIVTASCIYICALYSIIYIFFSTFSIIFKEAYDFSTFEFGLVFIACGIGTLSGLAYLGYFSDKTLEKRARAGRVITPEDRLPFLVTVPGALSFSLGIFVYGWGVEKRVHWVVPQVGTAMTGFGYILIFTAVQTYLIDTFENHSASANGANAALRGLAGALIPLSGLDLYKTLGWGWGNSLLAFIALALAPLLWILAVYGEKIRRTQLFKFKL
ncbi:MFS transporter/cycloheximide resistance protein [Trichoderma simmonsii]|uniref:MFS transporter/cycloheximide resistance protein n=1 Tax=Trichoderma simmonsii TaxID=1491479 RepID=A0A8G0PI63_9HYPO|nr:MFS transporter/cycloheximide resistance protein [Trichoderma simmonsii]